MTKTLAALLAAAACVPPSSHASDGQINFNGQLISTTCSVGNGGSTLLQVNLPGLATTAVAPVGGRTRFSLNVFNCAGAGSVTAFFSGTSVDPTTGYLKNNVAAGAGNVQLELLNGNGAGINLLGGIGNQSVASAPIVYGAASAGFAVQYRQVDTNAPVTAGAISSFVTYTMVYQ
jgi:major type 1 subunit fimbrin (pilin)